eukprot:GHVR01062886.1.p1 GENE.GHVR01062886.1~~GHVR01062886.1.p1  ORF type:complete len:108 (+),score=7.22 GHVR01062886.1:311-634(+)
MAFSDVQREVIVKEASDTRDALVADIKARGVWQRQTDTCFDVSVIDTNAPSHCNRTPEAVLASRALQKKKKYVAACEDRRASFTPLILSNTSYIVVPPWFPREMALI